VKREYHRWHSPSLGRDMELLVFGHAGRPYIVFPTSRGRFFEWEDRGMMATLSDRLDGGTLRLYCVDSIDGESWYNYGAHPHWRIERHLAYERYLLDEVGPLIRAQAPERNDPRFGVTGTSLGAFHAGLVAFRHPGAVARVVAMSGKFDNTMFLYGYSGMDAYLTNPLAFLPGLDDPRYLDPLRAMDVNLISGRDDPNVGEAIQLAHVLQSKAVPVNLALWDGWVHDWPYWHEMVRQFLW
jgi:esterase/lipase superfamily enzyme